MGKKQNRQVVSRVEKLQTLLKKTGFEGCLIEHPTDLFYLTGLELSAGQLIITETSTKLFVDGRYFEICKKEASFEVETSSVKALEASVKPLSSLLIDAENTTLSRYNALKKMFGRKLKFSDSLVKIARSIKDEKEIALLRKSAKLLWKGFQYISSKLKPGVTEEEIAKLFEIFCLKNGAERLAFDPIIAFGENSAMPHYRAGKRVLRKGDIVLIDIGIEVDHYRSDMTRTLSCGALAPKLLEMQRVVKEAHASALKKCRAGAIISSLDKAARKVMRSYGMEDLFVHSLGHGIGLDTHEFPRIRLGENTELEEGMVITIEPGLYLPGLGGVRYEDTVVVTARGFENFYPEGI